MTIDPAASAATLLERHRAVHPASAHDNLVVVTASAVAEIARPGFGQEIAHRWLGTTDGVLAAAGVALGGGDGRALTAEAIASVPSLDRVRMLEASEDFLACIDPAWAWQFLAPVASAHPSLGLSTAGYAELRGIRGAFDGGRSSATLFAEQLAADRVARAGLRGDLRGRGDPALRPLQGAEPGRTLRATAVPCYLAAASATDPVWGLDVFRSIERAHWSAAMYEALPLVVSRALGAGQEAALRAGLDARAGDLGEDRWLDALHDAGVLRDGEALDRAVQLAEQTATDGVAGEELGDAGFVFHILARARRHDLIVEWAVRWQIRLPILVAHLLPRWADLSSLASAGALDVFADQPDDSWPGHRTHAFGWWLDAGTTPMERVAAARDVLAVASAAPWTAAPGSFIDIVGARST
jgi:hypothetical protein